MVLSLLVIHNHYCLLFTCMSMGIPLFNMVAHCATTWPNVLWLNNLTWYWTLVLPTLSDIDCSTTWHEMPWHMVYCTMCWIAHLKNDFNLHVVWNLCMKIGWQVLSYLGHRPMLPCHTTWLILSVKEHFMLNSECHLTALDLSMFNCMAYGAMY